MWTFLSNKKLLQKLNGLTVTFRKGYICITPHSLTLFLLTLCLFLSLSHPLFLSISLFSFSKCYSNISISSTHTPKHKCPTTWTNFQTQTNDFLSPYVIKNFFSFTLTVALPTYRNILIHSVTNQHIWVL